MEMMNKCRKIGCGSGETAPIHSFGSINGGRPDAHAYEPNDDELRDWEASFRLPNGVVVLVSARRCTQLTAARISEHLTAFARSVGAKV